jgi:hypothetical protein
MGKLGIGLSSILKTQANAIPANAAVLAASLAFSEKV